MTASSSIKRRLIPFLGILGLITLATNTTPTEVLAQVTSGLYFIGDISIDEGGGKMTSGAYSLNNTSIGQPFAGAYYVNNQLVVGSGHAYKLDPYPTIAINNLRVSVGPGGTSSASNLEGVSGLRSDEGGTSFYNALAISPEISITNGNLSQVSLVGTAFTENRTDLTRFEDITASAHESDGFVLLYANTTTTKDYYDRTRSALRRQTFNANSYYAFVAGSWVPMIPGQIRPIVVGGNTIAGVSISNQSQPPLRPKFDIILYQSMGNRTWETYGVVSSVLPDIIRPMPTVK